MANSFGLNKEAMSRVVAATLAYERKSPNVDRRPAVELKGSSVGFWAKITDNVAVSGNANRWQYAWTEQIETIDGWEDKPSGQSGTIDNRFALNSIEANNTDAASTMGNSVDTSATSTTLSPVQGNPVVWMRCGWVKDGDGNVVPTYRFQYENSVECPDGGGG